MNEIRVSLQGVAIIRLWLSPLPRGLFGDCIKKHHQTRWYWVPKTLHQLFPQSSLLCWRAKRGVKARWAPCSTFFGPVRVLKISGHKSNTGFRGLLIFRCRMMHPLFCCIWPPCPWNVTSSPAYLVCWTLQKAYIPLFWKQTTPPSNKTWFAKINEVQLMEDLMSTAHHRRRNSLVKHGFTGQKFTFTTEYWDILGSQPWYPWPFPLRWYLWPQQTSLSQLYMGSTLTFFFLTSPRPPFLFCLFSHLYWKSYTGCKLVKVPWEKGTLWLLFGWTLYLLVYLRWLYCWPFFCMYTMLLAHVACLWEPEGSDNLWIEKTDRKFKKKNAIRITFAGIGPFASTWI